MRNININNRLAVLIPSVLGRRLPDGWGVERRSPEGSEFQVYAVQAPSGESGTVLARLVPRVEPREVAGYARELSEEARRTGGSPDPLLVAPFLSKRARERLDEEGVGYLDATGNARLVVGRPAVFVETAGASRPPVGVTGRARKTARTLRGAGAARVVRALCDGALPLPVGVTHLAKYAGVDAGQVSRVLDLLDREGVIERGGRGAVERVDVSALVRRWADDYSVYESNKVSSFFDPDLAVRQRRFIAAFGDAVADDALGRYAVTGALAAEKYAPYAPSATATVYVDEPFALAEALDLEETDDLANVFLLVPFDDVVFEGAREIEGLRYVAPYQAAADSLGGFGREPSAGDEMLRVLGGG